MNYMNALIAKKKIGYNMKTQFPLYWASHWPVTTKKTILKRKRSWREAEAELERICKGMKIKDAVLTSNYHDNKFHGSTAISLCFTHHGHEMAIFCDRYYSATHNLWAIVSRMQAAYMIEKYNLPICPLQNQN